MVLRDEGLVGENKRVLSAACVFVKPAAYPGLLLTDGVAVIDVFEAGDINLFTRRCPVIDDDETGVVARVAVVEGIAHAIQVCADRGRTAEIGSAEGVADTSCLRIIRLQGRNGVAVGYVGVGLVVAAHREESYVGVIERL